MPGSKSRPPSSWFSRMEKDVKKKNPSYNKDRVKSTVGKIWWGLSESKRKSIQKREEGDSKKKKADLALDDLDDLLFKWSLYLADLKQKGDTEKQPAVEKKIKDLESKRDELRKAQASAGTLGIKNQHIASAVQYLLG